MRTDCRALSPRRYTGKIYALKKACGLGLLCAQAALGLALGACSVSMPMGSLIGSRDDDETGTIPSPIGGLAGKDWQQAKIALDNALAAHDNSQAVPWNNPDSGTKGSFAAIGEAYTTVEGTCRGFHAAIDRKDENDQLQGTACADKPGDWQITDVKPLNKS